MSSEAFLKRANDCLSGSTLLDLKRLYLYKIVVSAIRQSYIDGNLSKESIKSLDELFSGVDEYSSHPHDCSSSLFRLYWYVVWKHSDSQFLKDFAEQAVNFYQAISNILLKQLGAKSEELKKTRDLMPIEKYPDIAGLEQAFFKCDPLGFEKAIARRLWAMIDAQAIDSFSCDQIFIYFFKLLICERFASLDERAGYSVFNGLVEKIISQTRESENL